MPEQLKIKHRPYILYKFFNSLFLGIGIGSYVSQYQPIKISEIALLGIIFSLLAIVIAKLYHRIMNERYFFRISLFVELVMLFWILASIDITNIHREVLLHTHLLQVIVCQFQQ